MSMKYEIVSRINGSERIIRSGIRRENGAIAERDIAVESAYANARKHCEGDPHAYAVRGPIDGDPNAEAVIYFDPIATIVTVITYRPVPRPEPEDRLEDELLASLIALRG